MPGPRAADADERGGAGRLFLGIAVPEAVAREVEQRVRSALGGRPLPGRPVPPANWHLTVRFLGDAPHERAARYRAGLRAADLGAAIEVGLGGWGAFPRPARACVLWLGLRAGLEPLARLAAVAEREARVAGFPPEARPFRPHLTLSRVRPPRDLRDPLAGLPDLDARFRAGEVTLFRSRPGSGPPRYQVVDRFALAAQA